MTKLQRNSSNNFVLTQVFGRVSSYTSLEARIRTWTIARARKQKNKERATDSLRTLIVNNSDSMAVQDKATMRGPEMEPSAS